MIAKVLKAIIKVNSDDLLVAFIELPFLVLELVMEYYSLDFS